MVWLSDIGGEREIKVSRELLSKVISTYKKAKIEAYLNLLFFPFHFGYLTILSIYSVLSLSSVCVLYLLALRNNDCNGLFPSCLLNLAIHSLLSLDHYLKALYCSLTLLTAFLAASAARSVSLYSLLASAALSILVSNTSPTAPNACFPPSNKSISSAND